MYHTNIRDDVTPYGVILFFSVRNDVASGGYKHKKKDTISIVSFLFGAANQSRTGDLILTKDALYLLSYSSIWRPGTGSNRRPLA